MSIYTKKWYFSKDFQWRTTVRGDVCEMNAMLEGFVRTTHECNSPDEVPKTIPPFKIIVHEGNVKFVNPFTGEEEEGKDDVAGKMYVINMKFFNPEKLDKGVYEQDLSLERMYTDIYPDMEAEITEIENTKLYEYNENLMGHIEIAEECFAPDGWDIMKAVAPALVKKFKECENMAESIKALNECSHLNGKKNESVEILNKVLVDKVNFFLGTIFTLEQLKYYSSGHDGILAVNMARKFVSDNYKTNWKHLL